MTTAATLSSVEGSFLWKLVTAQQQSAAAPRASLSGEFFIDRNGKVKSNICQFWTCKGVTTLERQRFSLLACFDVVLIRLWAVTDVHWWHCVSVGILAFTEMARPVNSPLDLTLTWLLLPCIVSICHFLCFGSLLLKIFLSMAKTPSAALGMSHCVFECGLDALACICGVHP